MVEYTQQLDVVFSSLSDPTRRNILKRLSKKSLNIGEIAKHYQLTFAAISKHLHVLERARLIYKTRHGKEQVVSIIPQSLAAANHYLENNFEQLWEQRLDKLDKYLKSTKK